MSKTKSDDLSQVVLTAKSQAKRRYDMLVAKIMAAQAAGLEAAAEAYQDELDDIERLRDVALRMVFGEGDGSQAPLPRMRPPTWKSAVLSALEGGPKAGMHVSQIFEAVSAMGVKTKGAKTSRDPLLLVDEALHRLGPKVRRVGRRVWAISARVSPEKR